MINMFVSVEHKLISGLNYLYLYFSLCNFTFLVSCLVYPFHPTVLFFPFVFHRRSSLIRCYLGIAKW